MITDDQARAHAEAREDALRESVATESFVRREITAVKFGASMKYATPLLGLTIVLASVVAAAAAEIPKPYRGEWCTTQWETIYKRCSSSDYFEIERTSWSTMEESCTLLTIRKSKYGGHRLSAVCHGDHLPKEGKPVEVRWWLGTNNTRLQVIEKVLPE